MPPHLPACLFQSAMAKRPYNLFHRKNLTCGRRTWHEARNKAAWDRPFEQHFQTFAAEANSAVFDNGTKCRARLGDALEVDGDYDLVYIDPPTSTQPVSVWTTTVLPLPRGHGRLRKLAGAG